MFIQLLGVKLFEHASDSNHISLKWLIMTTKIKKFNCSFYAIMVISLHESYMYLGKYLLSFIVYPFILAYTMLLQVMRTEPVHLQIYFVEILFVLTLISFTYYVLLIKPFYQTHPSSSRAPPSTQYQT